MGQTVVRSTLASNISKENFTHVGSLAEMHVGNSLDPVDFVRVSDRIATTRRKVAPCIYVGQLVSQRCRAAAPNHSHFPAAPAAVHVSVYK